MQAARSSRPRQRCPLLSELTVRASCGARRREMASSRFVGLCLARVSAICSRGAAAGLLSAISSGPRCPRERNWARSPVPRRPERRLSILGSVPAKSSFKVKTPNEAQRRGMDDMQHAAPPRDARSESPANAKAAGRPKEESSKNDALHVAARPRSKQASTKSLARGCPAARIAFLATVRYCRHPRHMAAQAGPGLNFELSGSTGRNGGPCGRWWPG